MHTKPDCMRPGCTRTAVARGLCKADHIRACKLVRDGRTTWASMESRGKVAPKGQGSITRWFLE